MQGYLGAIQDEQELSLVRVQPAQQAVERHEPGASAEDPVEPRPQLAASLPIRRPPEGFQVGVKPPDQGPHELLCRVLPVGEGVELVYQPLGMDPAGRMPVEREPAGVVGQDHRVGQQAMPLDAAPHRALGGDLDRIGRHRQSSGPELLEVAPPRRLVREVLDGMRGQLGDYRPGQLPLAHVGQGLGIHEIVAVAGAQHLEEVEPVVANAAKWSLPSWVQTPFWCWWRAPVSSTLIQRAVLRPARSTSRASARNASWLAFSSRTSWRLEIAMPRLVSCATRRGTVT